MPRFVPVLCLALSLSAAPAVAQGPTNPPAVPHPSYTIAPTGRTMPPTTGRAGAPMRPSLEAEMQKSQRETEARNKAWDSRMQRTMGSICKGC